MFFSSGLEVCAISHKIIMYATSQSLYILTFLLSRMKDYYFASQAHVKQNNNPSFSTIVIKTSFTIFEVYSTWMGLLVRQMQNGAK